MKKLLALILTVIMVLSVVPAMTLVSSAAAESIELGTYGSGAETWFNGSTGKSQTQLLIGVPTEAWTAYTGKVTWKNAAQNGGTPSITGGKIEFTVTDLDGTVTTHTCAPASSTTFNGKALLHMMTAEFATPTMPIQIGNEYTVTDVKLYVGDEVAYQSSNSLRCSWKAGNNDQTNAIFVNGVKADPQPTYKPNTDPYKNPVEVDWITYNNLWFEKHDSWGKVMMVGFDQSVIPAGGNTGDNTITKLARIEVTINGAKKVIDNFAPGNESFSLGANIIFRVPFSPLPSAGSYEDVLIEFIRKSDNKVMYTGKVDITSPGDPDADKAGLAVKIEDETVPAGNTFDATIAIENVPTQGVNGWQFKLVYDKTLVEPVSVTLPTIDGIQVLGGINTTTGTVYGVIPGKDGTGVTNYASDFDAAVVTFKALRTAEVGATATIGAEVEELFYTVANDPYEVDIETRETTTDSIKIGEATAILGDVDRSGVVNGADRTALAQYTAKWDVDIDLSVADLNNDGKVTAADRNILARHLAKWTGYEELPYLD